MKYKPSEFFEKTSFNITEPIIKSEKMETLDNKIRNEIIDKCIEILEFHRNSYDGIEWAIREIKELKEKL